MNCSIVGCEERHNARGYCTRHYMRYRKYGDANYTKNYYTKFYDTDTRLRGMVKAYKGCWLTHTDNKYVLISINHETKYVHRVAYSTWVGPIPEGGYIIHKCNNKACINPKHLLLSTQKVNMIHTSLKPRTTRKVEDGTGN